MTKINAHSLRICITNDASVCDTNSLASCFQLVAHDARSQLHYDARTAGHHADIPRPLNQNQHWSNRHRTTAGRSGCIDAQATQRAQQGGEGAVNTAGAAGAHAQAPQKRQHMRRSGRRGRRRRGGRGRTRHGRRSRGSFLKREERDGRVQGQWHYMPAVCEGL